MLVFQPLISSFEKGLANLVAAKVGMGGRYYSIDVEISESIVFWLCIGTNLPFRNIIIVLIRQFKINNLEKLIHKIWANLSLLQTKIQGIHFRDSLYPHARELQTNKLVGRIPSSKSSMNKCYTCKNNRRHLLKLQCSHDVCIKCAADNYFINCKNKINPKKSQHNNYFCEKCLEQTELEANTIEQLKNYFMQNIDVDEKQKNARREKITQREQTQKERMERLARLDVGSGRPKSLQIQIAERKRTLSKYLNEKQVDKFLMMQQEYQQPRRTEHKEEHQHQFTLGSDQKFTPQTHRISETTLSNEYELVCGDSQRRRGDVKPFSGKLIKNVSEEYEQPQVRKQLNRVRSQEFDRVSQLEAKKKRQKYRQQAQHQMEYDLYHNGKAVPNYNPTKADYLLYDKQRNNYDQKSRHSSKSSGKAIGMIRSKKPNQPQSFNPIPHTESNSLLPDKIQTTDRYQRFNSMRSQQNIRNVKTYCNQTEAPMEPNLKNTSSSADWDIDSKSTKRYEQKTVPHAERRSVETMEKILDHLEFSQAKLERIKEKSSNDEKSRSKIQPLRENQQIYLCKIHQDEEIIYFCLKCNQLICSQCALRGSHKQHQIYSLKKSSQILRQNLSHKVNTLTKLMMEEESKQKIFKECVNEITLQCSRQKQKIKSSFESFIFSVDKKYKEVLKEIDEKFNGALGEYLQKLNQSRNNYVMYSQVKDDYSQTLEACRFQDDEGSQQMLRPTAHELGHFHVRTHRSKQKVQRTDIESIHKLISKINQAVQFLKSTNLELFSSKKQSLLSERSSLKLSDSSNLLEEQELNDFATPTTNTPAMRSSGESPNKKVKKIIVGAYCLNVSSHVRVVRCDAMVDGLLEMESIVKALKLDWLEYGLKALS